MEEWNGKEEMEEGRRKKGIVEGRGGGKKEKYGRKRGMEGRTNGEGMETG